MPERYVNYNFRKKPFRASFENACDLAFAKALNAIKRDGLPDIGSNEIRLHHNEENGEVYLDDKRTASFRIGNNHAYGVTLYGWHEDDGWVNALVLNLHDNKVMGTLSGILTALSTRIDREEAFCQRATGKKNSDAEGLNSAYMVAARQNNIDASNAAQEFLTALRDKLRQCCNMLPISKIGDNPHKESRHSLQR